MPDNSTPIETLFEKAEEYSKTSIELFKLNAIDKSADVVSALVSQTVVLIAVALFVLVINIGTALWIGERLGKSYYGFFAIAGLYAIIAILLYIVRHAWIKAPVRNSIIKQMLKQKTI